MTKYKVHVYVGIRIPIEVEAENMSKACEVAEEKLDVERYIDHSRPIEWQAEDCEAPREFLVDLIPPNGDVDPENSQWFDQNYEPN